MGPEKAPQGPGCSDKCLYSPGGNSEPGAIILPLPFPRLCAMNTGQAEHGQEEWTEAEMTSARASGTEHLFSEASLPRGRAASQGAGCGGSASLPRPSSLAPVTSAPAGSLLGCPNLGQGPSCCPHGTQAHLPTAHSVRSCPFSGFPSTGHWGAAPWSYFL